MRRYLNITHENEQRVKKLLASLIDPSTNSQDYRASFLSLGEELGSVLKRLLPKNYGKDTLVACASEDADWLTVGLLNGLEVPTLPVAVFWADRYTLPDGKDITSITKTYQDEIDGECRTLIITKSIINTSCVVKTQILRLISHITPNKIFIVTPVMHKNSEDNLLHEFPADLSPKIQFLTFAIDDEINDNKEVVPGIGGMVYPRLGLNPKTYIPQLVKHRMA